MIDVTAADLAPVLRSLAEGHRRLEQATTEQQREHALFVMRTHTSTLTQYLEVRTQNERTTPVPTFERLMVLAEHRLAQALRLLTPEQLVGAYHVANLLPAGLETLWEQVDGHMEKRGLPRPERLAALDTADATPRPDRCVQCDDEAQLIYDTCGHGS